MPSTEMLSRYAAVAVDVGVGLRPGDRLLVRSSVEVPELTRLVVERAYENGASNVDVLWGDEAVSRARFSHGSPEAAETVGSVAHFLVRAIELGDSILTIDARDPDALQGQDVERVGRFQKVNSKALEPFYSALGALSVPWSVIAAPTAKWAGRVFGDMAEDEAVEALWSAVFRATRVDHPDPLAAWEEHLSELGRRREHLNSMGLVGLRYQGPGTDLVVGLPEGARWVGGSVTTPRGRRFVPNIPTEEVFTAPHRLKADGRVTATKPLSLFGNLVEGFAFELSGGEITGVTAERGRDVLDQLISTDEGSARLGEAAMVPMSGAVASEGLVWSNTLFDENDGCHIAIGRAYPTCVEGGTEMPPEELSEAGLNHSSAHVDFVVGSSELDVIGVDGDGGETPVISGGEWAF